jgi:hypothetical protein
MQSRLQGFWSGVRRGSKFGLKVGFVILLVLYGVGGVLIAVIPEMRESLLADLGQESLLSALGGFLGGTALFLLYCVIPSAIIMGLIEMKRAAPVTARFSLRTLLIAMTLVAVALGLIVWAFRAG